MHLVWCTPHITYARCDTTVVITPTRRPRTPAMSRKAAWAAPARARCISQSHRASSRCKHACTRRCFCYAEPMHGICTVYAPGAISRLSVQQVLRFSTRIHNIGCAPFVVGVPSGWNGSGTSFPPPSPPTPPPSLSDQRRLSTDGVSATQQPPPSFDPRRRPNPDGSYAWGDNQRKGGFNTSNSFNNGDGHYSNPPNPNPNPAPYPIAPTLTL